MRLVILIAITAASCAAPSSEPSRSPASVTNPPSSILANARLPGSVETLSVRIEGGTITHVGVNVPPAAATRNVAGAFVVPQVIDSHVHLEYYSVRKRLSAEGVAATIDLGAPIATLAKRSPHDLSAGPMITSPGGYPTESWGQDGYGLEVSTAAQARAAVDRLAAAGARLIKVPLRDAGGLGDDLLVAAVKRAHEHNLVVAGHALSAADVGQAAAAGVDVLAHTPLDLDEATVAAWAPRPVITTLAAFNRERAAANLARLRAAGSPVLYGTDLGNTREANISRTEIVAMTSAGMSGAEILTAMTSAPAAFWKLEVGRAIAPGARACLMTVAADPHRDPTVLSEPQWVSPCGP